MANANEMVRIILWDTSSIGRAVWDVVDVPAREIEEGRSIILESQARATARGVRTEIQEVSPLIPGKY